MLDARDEELQTDDTLVSVSFIPLSAVYVHDTQDATAWASVRASSSCIPSHLPPAHSRNCSSIWVLEAPTAHLQMPADHRGRATCLETPTFLVLPPLSRRVRHYLSQAEEVARRWSTCWGYRSRPSGRSWVSTPLPIGAQHAAVGWRDRRRPKTTGPIRSRLAFSTQEATCKIGRWLCSQSSGVPYIVRSTHLQIGPRKWVHRTATAAILEYNTGVKRWNLDAGFV